MAHTVLLVDDDSSLLQALRRGLRQEPYSVVLAENAWAALEVMRQQTIDVVLSDENMPGMSGTQFLARVHAEYPDTIRIMLTGGARLETAIQAINQGHVYRFFTKPCQPVELALGIRQALQQRALLLESRRLLVAVRRQSAALQELEDEMRGLTHVDRDEAGAIVVNDVPMELEDLLKETEKELATIERRLDRRDTLRRAPGGGGTSRP